MPCCVYHISVIIMSHLGARKDPSGNNSGLLMGELPSDEHITELASSGSKLYGYVHSGGRCCLKVKGITLTRFKK